MAQGLKSSWRLVCLLDPARAASNLNHFSTLNARK